MSAASDHSSWHDVIIAYTGYMISECITQQFHLKRILLLASPPAPQISYVYIGRQSGVGITGNEESGV